MLLENNMPPTNPFFDSSESKTLEHLFSSKEWRDYLHNLSLATGFAFEIYNENGISFLSINEHPICKLIKASVGAECPAFCNGLVLQSLKSAEPQTFKCYAKITNFLLPIIYNGGKVFLIGRKGFSSYEDFIDLFRITKEKDININEIPISTSLSFTNEDFIKNISLHIRDIISSLLENFNERGRLSEKIGRFTSLVGTDILEALSQDIQFVCRYVVDTIEFVISPPSVFIMILDKQSHIYKTECVTGKHGDVFINLQLNQDEIFKNQKTTKSSIYPVILQAEKFITPAYELEEARYIYLFPFSFNNATKGLVGILNSHLTQEDIKIINAFRDHMELTYKNYALRFMIGAKMDEMLTYISESSKSFVQILDFNQLLQKILEEALKLLKAEQGSLMLLEEATHELVVKALRSTEKIEEETMKIGIGEGIAGKVFEAKETWLIKDIEIDQRIGKKNKSRYKTKSFISISLMAGGKAAGALNVSDKVTGEAFNENDLKLIQLFAANASIAIERSWFCEKVKELKQLSITDHLTGILNRRYLDSRLHEEIARFNRHKYPFSFMMIDIDGFKEYNDTFGHNEGDKVLKIIATTIVNSLRSMDIAIRFGGDEFVLILPQTYKIEAINIANRIKENVEKTYIPHMEELTFKPLTVSIGLSSYPEHASSAAELLERTDQALYLAKKGGGNRLVYL